MKRVPLKKGVNIESNTYYYFEGEKFEVKLNETTEFVANPRYIKKNLNYFPNVAFVLKDLENVTLDFGGAILYMQGKVQPFVIENCKNITIKNVALQYDRSHFTEGEILEIDEEHIRLKIDKERYPYEIVDGKIVFYSDTWRNETFHLKGGFHQAFDKKTGRGIDAMVAAIGDEIYQNPNNFCSRVHLIPEEDGDELVLHGRCPDWYLEKFKTRMGEEGAILNISHEHRDLCCVRIFDGSDTYIENFRLINGSGMGIYPTHTKNLYLDRYILHKEDGDIGLVNNSADALHPIACSGEIVIKNCVFEGMVDDSLNIHGAFYFAGQGDSEGVTATCAVTYDNGMQGFFDKGDRIGIFKGNTMELRDEYIVTDVKAVEGRTIKLYTDRPVECNEGDLIENLSMQPDITIENSVFAKANSHLRFQSRGKIRVSDSRIELPVLLTGDASYWLESSPVTDMVIENCEFNDKGRIRLIPEVMPTEKEPYYHKNITIKNCTFESDLPIEGGYTDNITFVGNTNSKGLEMTLDLTNCGRVNAENCKVVRKTEIKTALKRN